MYENTEEVVMSFSYKTPMTARWDPKRPVIDTPMFLALHTILTLINFRNALKGGKNHPERARIWPCEIRSPVKRDELLGLAHNP